MCILALITNYSARFPFILITNRDEVLDRLTYPLAVDAATGLLWAVDGVAGGSWLGVQLRHGRLATVTNCRRAPTAPLRFRSAEAEAAMRQRCPALFAAEGHGWRGAAPLSDTLAFTHCVPCGSAARTLVYQPTTSRGTLIKEYLMHGQLPGGEGPSTAAAAADDGWPPSLRSPFYAGYNLITCDSLFGSAGGAAKEGERPFTAMYTTNRFYADHGVALTHGEVHCLQNSFLDNWAEPKSTRLRALFEGVLRDTVRPLSAAAQSSPLTPSAARGVASAFTDTCLCDTLPFNVRQLAEDEGVQRCADDGGGKEGGRGGGERMTLQELLRSTDPRLGLTEAELRQHFPTTRPPHGTDSPLTDGGAVEKECHLQRSIFVTPSDGYGTRVQSVVFAERCASAGDAVPVYTTHFCQRQVTPAGEGDAVGRCGPWVHFTITQDGVQQHS